MPMCGQIMRSYLQIFGFKIWEWELGVATNRVGTGSATAVPLVMSRLVTDGAWPIFSLVTAGQQCCEHHVSASFLSRRSSLVHQLLEVFISHHWEVVIFCGWYTRSRNILLKLPISVLLAYSSWILQLAVVHPSSLKSGGEPSSDTHYRISLWLEAWWSPCKQG